MSARPQASQAGEGAAPRGEGPIVVVALGGNALLKRGEPLTMEVQRHK